MAKKKELWKKVMLERGHSPILDEDNGKLDNFVYDNGFHNGPGCSKCGWMICWNCESDPYKAVQEKCGGKDE